MIDLGTNAATPVALEPLPSATVTVLADNICGDDEVLGEWGLSFLLEAGGARILLDTGAGHVLGGNARALKVDLASIDALVISHGHYDHTGGIGALLPARGRLRVYVHPAAFGTSYWKRRRTVEIWRMKPSREDLAAQVREVVETTAPTFVTPAVLATGEIPRDTDFEDTGLTSEAFLDEALTTPDPIRDDQALVFRVPQGVVVLLGCGHSGLVNTLRRVRALLSVDHIHAVMGGSHLISASPARMARTIAELEAVGVERILLSHCTGTEAFAQLVQAFPGRCAWPRAGTVVRFGSVSE